MLREPPCMGSKQRVRVGFEDDASCEIEECEAAGADLFDMGRGGRHKGACEGGERDWDGVCSAPLSHLLPGLLLDGQQRHLRQKLVDEAPQTVVVVAD
eukprot:1838934-Prymnesium_polylepis.1